jgi:hypothetical protein
MAGAYAQPSLSRAWKLHVADNSSKGADGVRLWDVDKDGLLDIATGWEEGGRIRVYRNPGPREATKPWPATTAGKAGAPEDAVFVDLDGDGAVDVVSSCEGKERKVARREYRKHWRHRKAPNDRSENPFESPHSFRMIARIIKNSSNPARPRRFPVAAQYYGEAFRTIAFVPDPSS